MSWQKLRGRDATHVLEKFDVNEKERISKVLNIFEVKMCRFSTYQCIKKELKPLLDWNSYSIVQQSTC
jgi:hypothetical protein